MSTVTSPTSSASSTTSSTNTWSSMTPQDFIKMLIAELQNQDPTQPVDNSQILQQVSQIDNIVTNENPQHHAGLGGLAAKHGIGFQPPGQGCLGDGCLREPGQRPGEQHFAFRRHRHDQRQRNEHSLCEHYFHNVLLSGNPCCDSRGN